MKVEIGEAYHDRRISVISLERGEIFHSDNPLPKGVNALVEIEHLPGGRRKMSHVKFRAKENLLLVAQGIHKSNCGADRIRFIRIDRRKDGGVESPRFAHVKVWAKMRLALMRTREPRVHAFGGLRNALVYKDEIIVVGFGNQRSSGWIIPKLRIAEILASMKG